jgi:hypothetical protein
MVVGLATDPDPRDPAPVEAPANVNTNAERVFQDDPRISINDVAENEGKKEANDHVAGQQSLRGVADKEGASGWIRPKHSCRAARSGSSSQSRSFLGHDLDDGA